MKSLHAKSPCCSASVNRFGKRRRQCSQCHGTWRIKQKRRGRKRLRATALFASRVLEQTLPALRKVSKQTGRGREQVRGHFLRSLRVLLRTLSFAPLPKDCRFVALADAFEERIGGVRYTIFLILLKPVGKERAIICPPFIAEGPENLAGWSRAFAQLPTHAFGAICTLVCDGRTALRSLAIGRHWILQRCQFHLLLGLRNYLSSGAMSRQKVLSFLVFSSVEVILHSRDAPRVRRSRRHLATLSPLISSRGLRKVMSGFLKYSSEYRAYLRHPHLRLPATSNACESVVQTVRDVLYRTKGFRSVRSFDEWTRVALMKRRTVLVKPSCQPN